MRGMLVATFLCLFAFQPAQASHRHRTHHHFSRHAPIDLGRPFHIVGDLVVGLLHFAFGTGGYAPSIPLGTYKITPEAVGPWGQRHDAIGLANNTIKDPKLGVREGIELHAGKELSSLGCVVVREDQWRNFKEAVLEQKHVYGDVYLHVGVNSATISPEE